MTQFQLILIVATGVVVVLLALLLVRRFKPRKLNTGRFQDKWRNMQKLCADKQTWRQAIIDADALLDDALKKRRFAGKSMGERLTKAQRLLTNNEAVWFGHKLRTKLEADPDIKPKESEVKQALLGIRQALKDLGALPDAK